MSDKWNHAICVACWNLAHPEAKAAADEGFISFERQTVACCFCAQKTAAGIYVRRNPVTVPCGGRHD